MEEDIGHGSRVDEKKLIHYRHNHQPNNWQFEQPICHYEDSSEYIHDGGEEEVSTNRQGNENGPNYWGVTVSHQERIQQDEHGQRTGCLQANQLRFVVKPQRI